MQTELTTNKDILTFRAGCYGPKNFHNKMIHIRIFLPLSERRTELIVVLNYFLLSEHDKNVIPLISGRIFKIFIMIYNKI